MQLLTASYLPSIMLLLLMGGFGLMKNSREALNKTFFLLTLTIATWLTTLLVADLRFSLGTSLYALRVGNFVGMLLVPTVLYFAVYFPVQVKRLNTAFHVFAWLPTILFMTLAFTPLMIPSVNFEKYSAQPTNLNFLYSLQSIYVLIGWLLAFWIMIKKIKAVDARGKTQIRLVVIGMITCLTVNFGTGFVLTALGKSNDYSNQLGSYSILIFIGATTYAIVKYRLFDIRLAIIRLTGYVLTIAIIAALYSVLVIVVGVKLLKVDTDNLGPLITLFISSTVFVSLTFHRIQVYITRLTTRLFYQYSYSLRDVLGSLTDVLVAENSIDNLSVKSMGIISQAIQPSSVHMMVVNHDGSFRWFKTNSEKQEPLQAIIEKAVPLNKIVVDKSSHIAGLSKRMSEQDIDLVLLIGVPQKKIGAIVFGPKKNGSMYSRQDIELLQIASKNLATSLENASKYEQIRHFAETLKQEVEHATHRLRQANEKLKTLDKLKDDFISMASHQFRTPAGSIRQALQMINNPQLTQKDRKEMLRLAEANSEELVSVVATMLSISRLQAGRFVITKAPAELTPIVEKVISTVEILAEQKDIKLTFKPTEPIAMSIDKVKIKEAMTNYIENAIKYSPPNSTVCISLKHEEGYAVFEVADEGMGVPAPDRAHLFGKFYRAENAREQQPDGNGIGLYVVKSIIEGHNGEAYYHPGEESGSVFGFRLPTETAPHKTKQRLYSSDDTHGDTLIT